MKDFLGKELNIGDSVVVAVGHGRNSGASLVKGIVEGFTDKFVKIDMPDYTGYTGKFGKTKTSPRKVVKIA